MAAAVALACSMLAGPFAGTAAAYTLPTHTYTSAKTWQCSDNAFEDLTYCAWAQYSVSYHVTLTRYSGYVHYSVQPIWASTYVWGASTWGYNQWYGMLGAMHATADIYTYPDNIYRGRWTLSPGTCNGTVPLVGGSDLWIEDCTNNGIGIDLAAASTYPMYICYHTYFDSTLMYDNDFGFSICYFVAL